MSSSSSSEVLNSWKEVASYVGRGVRTIQRWEQDLRFPVRRPRGKLRSAVLALKPEIDAWLRTSHAETATKPTAHTIHQQNHAKLMNNAQVLRARVTVLQTSSDALQKQVLRAISMGSVLRSSCKTGTAETRNWAGTKY